MLHIFAFIVFVVMKKFIAIILSLLVYHLHANDSIRTKTNLIGIVTGYGYHSNIDPYASSNIYAGSFMPIRFSWVTFSNKYTDELMFSYFSMKLEPLKKSDQNLTDFHATCFNISYGYHRKIVIRNNNTAFLGASVNSLLTFKDLKFMFFYNVDYKPVDFFNSLNLSLVNKTRIKNDIVFVRFKYMIISYIMYNKYGLGAPFYGDFFLFTKCVSFDLNVNYNLRLSKYLFVSLGYQYFYFSYPKYKNDEFTKGGYNQFTIGLNVKL
jgi:hypothetical protein